MIDPFNTGAIAFHIMLAGGLTLVVGIVLLVLYRRAVQRWMLASATAGATATDEAATAVAAPMSELAIDIIDAAAEPGATRRGASAIGAATLAFHRAALVYTLAGLAYAAVATALQIGLGLFGFLPIRATVVWCAHAWPVVLTLVLFWGPDRRRQLATCLAYAAVLALLGLAVGLSDTPPLPIATLSGFADLASAMPATAAHLHDRAIPAFVQPLLLWFILACPTVYLLLVLNRRVRAIGSVLLVAMLVAAAGVHLTTVFLASDLGRAVFMAVNDIVSVGAWTWLYGLLLVALLLFLIPGWFAVAGLARCYERKAISDQTLVFDAIWLFATLLLCQDLGWSGLLAFAAYKLVTRFGLRPVARQARDRPPVRLLLLRVFGFQRRTESFFAVLCARWRYAGSIQLIAASDLASATIDPGEFMLFLSGKLRRLFIQDRADLQQRLDHLDLRPDPDGRFRVNEFYCTADTWRDAAMRLMRSSHFVVMDLRGFAPANKGCIFELQALFNSVALAHLAILIDRTTELPFLQQTLAACWQRLQPTSPNRLDPAARLRLLRIGGGSADATRTLLAIADRSLAATTP